MLRWFPRLQAATTCFSCSPPDLNFLDPYFTFMYVHNNHCHRATAHLKLNILLLFILSALSFRQERNWCVQDYYYYYYYYYYLMFNLVFFLKLRKSEIACPGECLYSLGNCIIRSTTSLTCFKS